MTKFYFASFNRASDGAIASMKALVKENDMLTESFKVSDYIIAVGDRVETFECAWAAFFENKPIIHFWAGEQDNFATHDDVYRASISLMSDVQLCVNADAKDRVHSLFRAVGKKPNTFIVGNPYLDDMRTDDSVVPDEPYDLILYNPVSRDSGETESDISDILETIDKDYIWIKPNGDKYSDLVPWNTDNLPRDKYLGLLKNCQRFITNSSSQFTEAAFFHKDVVQIGKRNEERDSRYSDMMIPGCKEKVLEVLKSLA